MKSIYFAIINYIHFLHSSVSRKSSSPVDPVSAIWPTAFTRLSWPWSTQMRPEDFQCTPFTIYFLTLARLCTLPWASLSAWHAAVCADAPFLLTEEGSSETHITRPCRVEQVTPKWKHTTIPTRRFHDKRDKRVALIMLNSTTIAKNSSHLFTLTSFKTCVFVEPKRR